jgi:hypothetical protein
MLAWADATLMSVATLYRHCGGTALTLAVMGYHFQVKTSRLTDPGEVTPISKYIYF